MADIQKIQQSFKNIEAVGRAADAVIASPQKSFKEELAKQQIVGTKLAASYAASGTAGLIAATGAGAISAGIAGLLGGMGAAAAGAAATGPIGWAVGGVVLIGGGAFIYKKVKAAKRARQEKERMLYEIIRKKQAIIDKLMREKELNQNEIENLKETLSVLEQLINSMNQAA